MHCTSQKQYFVIYTKNVNRKMIWSISFLFLSICLLKVQGPANISIGSVLLVSVMAFALTDILQEGSLTPTGSTVLEILKNLKTSI